MDRPGFTFLACPDPEIIRERIDRLLGESGAPFEKIVFWGDEELGPPFWNALTVGSLFAGGKAVVLRRAESCPAEFWPKLAPALRGFNPAVWPFFCLEGAFDRKGPKIPKALSEQPYFKVAGKRNWLFVSPGLSPRDMGPLLSDWAAARGLAFEPGAAERLAAALPLDLARADNELARLELSLGDRATVTVADAAQFGRHEELDGFAFLDAVASGRDPAAVWRGIFDKQLAGEEMVFPLIGLLLYEARTMWRIAAGDDGDIRLPPSILQKKRAMARRLGATGLARLFEAAFAAEAGIKSGSRRTDQALEYLTAELFRIFGGQTRAAGRASP
jgi:DNA polymerase-3 subunit delta